MPEAIRSRYSGDQSANDAEGADEFGVRLGASAGEDSLDEMTRIMGETTRGGIDSVASSAARRDYVRRDTSWRDPQARTVVRETVAVPADSSPMDSWEADFINEINSVGASVPAAAVGGGAVVQRAAPVVDPRVPAMPAAGYVKQSPASGVQDASGRSRAAVNNEVNASMNAVLRTTTSATGASEDIRMTQPPHFNPAPVPRSASVLDSHALYEETDLYAGHDDHDPAGAQNNYPDETAFYAASGFEDERAYEEGHDPFAAGVELSEDYRRTTQRRGGSAIVLGIASVAAILILGVGSVYAYRSMVATGTTVGNAPLIRADAAPIKEIVAPKPVVADTTALDTTRQEGQDKLVTRAEDPVDQIPGKPPVRVVGPGASSPSLAPVQHVRSVIVRPDGSIVLPDEAPKVMPVSPPVRSASLPLADTSTATTTPVQAQPAPAVVAPPAQTSVTPPPQPVPPPPAAPQARVEPPAPKPSVTPVPVAAPIAAAPKPAPAPVPVPPPARPARPVLAPQPALVQHAAPQPAASDVGEPLALGPQPGPSQAPAQPSPVRVATATAPAAPQLRAASGDAGGGEYMVQISSQRSDAEARHALQAAEQKYAGLGVKGGDVQQADLGARGTYYRARLAGGTRDQAAALCAQIKSQGGDCVIAKR